MPIWVWTPEDASPHRATVLYVHGYDRGVLDAVRDHQLQQAFERSMIDATFVVVPGPTADGQGLQYPDLDALLQALHGKLGTGPVIALGYSGGYRTIASWVGNPRLREVGLIDGLYKPTAFNAWNGRTTLIGAGDTDKASEAYVRARGGLALPELPATWPDGARLASNVYAPSGVPHAQVMFARRPLDMLLSRVSVPHRQAGLSIKAALGLAGALAFVGGMVWLWGRDPGGALGKTSDDWWRRHVTQPEQACYRTKSAALQAFRDVNRGIIEEWGGLDREDSAEEYDAINHKYALSGKRAVRSLSQALWAVMPSKPPFCLDQLDLAALNDTSPGRIGSGFRLPDWVAEGDFTQRQEEHYRKRPRAPRRSSSASKPIPFIVPPEWQALLDQGVLVRRGVNIVWAKSGRILAHVREVPRRLSRRQRAELVRQQRAELPPAPF